MSNYFLKPKLGTIKQSFSLENEEGKVIYEGKMTKFKLFGAAPHEFINHITNKTETHNIGKTVTIEENRNDIATIKTSTPKGKSLITTDMYYDVICDEKDLDLVFLVAFSIAKTEQTFYN